MHGKLVKIALGAVLALAATSTVALAQQSTATTSANAGVTIIAAIGIANTADLNFGAVAAGATLGTVVQTAAASPSRSATGGTTLGIATAVSPATFTVSGEPNATYTVTLPTGAATISGPGTDMTIDNWLDNAVGTLSGGGTQTLYVGGTLHVGANQVAGAYTGTFNVTVTYN